MRCAHVEDDCLKEAVDAESALTCTCRLYMVGRVCKISGVGLVRGASDLLVWTKVWTMGTGTGGTKMKEGVAEACSMLAGKQPIGILCTSVRVSSDCSRESAHVRRETAVWESVCSSACCAQAGEQRAIDRV